MYVVKTIPRINPKPLPPMRTPAPAFVFTVDMETIASAVLRTDLRKKNEAQAIQRTEHQGAFQLEKLVFFCKTVKTSMESTQHLE